MGEHRRKLIVVADHFEQPGEHTNLPAGQAKRVHLIRLENTIFPFELIRRVMQINLAHQRLDRHDRRDSLAHPSHRIDFGPGTDNPRLAQNLPIGLAANLQLLLRSERERLLAMPWPLAFGLLNGAGRDWAQDAEQSDRGGELAHRLSDPQQTNDGCRNIHKPEALARKPLVAMQTPRQSRQVAQAFQPTCVGQAF